MENLVVPKPEEQYCEEPPTDILIENVTTPAGDALDSERLVIYSEGGESDTDPKSFNLGT